MARFDWVLSLDPHDPQPRYLQIARAIADAITRGRLAAGDRLPGTRTLAERLDVQRNTVVAAYDELRAEGWIEMRPQQGTFVADDIPETPQKTTRPDAPVPVGFRLPRRSLRPSPQIMPPHVLLLSGGIPDLRMMPIAALGRAYQRALKSRGRQLLAYQDAFGHPDLRVALAQMVVAERAMAVTADQILVTRGAQMAFDLIARTLCEPGDMVAVESLGYPPAWEAFRAAGAKLLPIDVDGQGLRIDQLEKKLEHKRLRAVYLTPHHQYPTMTLLSPARRLALIELARQHRFAIIEDDYDNEIHYSGQPVLPLAAHDPHGVVIYVSTLSKTLAPGLRLGFVVAPTPFVERLVDARSFIDRQGDHILEQAVAELFEDGEIQRHVRRTRKVYKARRAVFADLLATHLGDVLTFDLPPGGLALWPYVDPSIDPEDWVARARKHDVMFIAGRALDFKQRRQPHLRIGFAALNESELEEAVIRMTRALAARS